MDKKKKKKKKKKKTRKNAELFARQSLGEVDSMQ